jgi:head-tail adaptor
MRAGKLDVRIALQRKTTSLSPSGEPSESWVTLAERWSSIDPIQGDERNAAEQWIAREQAQFIVRWSQDIDDLSPLDRVIYPVSDASLSPSPSRSIYDIISVLEKGRNDQLIIQAARRVA